MDIDERTILQKEFELQTPTIRKVGGREYLRTYCAWLEFQHEAQQKEIERLKEDKLFYSNQWEKVSKENTKLKEEIEQFNEDNTILSGEIRILKQYAEIARNDKRQRKIRLNEALKEIKELNK